MGLLNLSLLFCTWFQRPRPHGPGAIDTEEMALRLLRLTQRDEEIQQRRAVGWGDLEGAMDGGACTRNGGTVFSGHLNAAKKKHGHRNI